MNTKEIVEKVFAQAEEGQVKFGDEKLGYWSFYTKFYANIEGKCNAEGYEFPVLDIPSYEEFLLKIEKYLEVAKDFYSQDEVYYEISGEAFKEKLFFDLIINTTIYDETNLNNYIQRRTNMLQNDFPKESFSLGKFGAYDLKCQISKNRSNLESPFKCEMGFQDESGDCFNLPAVNFGIDGNSCYIFSIQNDVYKQHSPLAKRVDRYFRKVNGGVDMEDIVANVSPNALVSLTVFSSFLKQNKIMEVVAPDFMPIRYNTNLEAKTKRVADDDSFEKIDRDQFNMTNKFMYLFLRYNHHFPEAVADYDIDKGEMHLALKNGSKIDENIIYDIDEIVDLSGYKKMQEKEEMTK